MSTNAPLYGTSTRTTPTLHGRFFLTGVAFVASLGAFLAPSLSTSAHQLPGPAATPPPHITGSEQETNPDATGYRGSATNTNELSSAWASGVATAWTLPTSDTLLPAQLIAEGSTLYVLTYGSGSQAVATVSAYDVSGSEPVAQWTTTGPQPSRIRTEAFPSSVSTQDEILLSDIIVDRATGAQPHAARGALELFEVDAFGLDRLDRAVLDAMCRRFAGGPVGLTPLAVTVGEEAETVETVAEPYLVREGFILRTTRGRMATAKAWKHLGLTPPPESTLFE